MLEKVLHKDLIHIILIVEEVLQIIPIPVPIQVPVPVPVPILVITLVD
jgi:hypothetical protein